MDWLRSCYASTWRLTTDPTVLTPGYFYFSPPGSPHMPFPHDFGSRVWVSDDFSDPPNGEASGPQLYNRGMAPPMPPLAKAFGTPPQLAGGIALGSGSGPLMPYGVNVACYVGAVPDPGPSLWLVSADLKGFNQNSPVFTWKDRSVYNRDAVPAFGFAAPFWDSSLTAFPLVLFQPGQTLNLAVTDPLGSGDWTAFLVAFLYLGTANSGSVQVLVPSGPQGKASLFGANNVTSVALPNATAVYHVTPAVSLHLYTAGRRGASCFLRKDGVQVATGPATAVLATLAQLAGSIRGTGASLPFAGLAEVVLFDQPLSDAGLASQESRLISTYNLP